MLGLKEWVLWTPRGLYFNYTRVWYC